MTSLEYDYSFSSEYSPDTHILKTKCEADIYDVLLESHSDPGASCPALCHCVHDLDERGNVHCMRLAENIGIITAECLWPDAQMFLRTSEAVLGFSVWQMKLFCLILFWRTPHASKVSILISKNWRTKPVKRQTLWRPPINLGSTTSWRTFRAGLDRGVRPLPLSKL